MSLELKFGDIHRDAKRSSIECVSASIDQPITTGLAPLARRIYRHDFHHNKDLSPILYLLLG